MVFRGGLNDLSIPLSISSTLRWHNFFCIDAIIYSHKIRSRVDAAASTQGCIDASLPKLHRKFHLQPLALFWIKPNKSSPSHTRVAIARKRPCMKNRLIRCVTVKGANSGLSENSTSTCPTCRYLNLMQSVLNNLFNSNLPAVRFLPLPVSIHNN